MSFHLSAQDIRVEDNRVLVGDLQNEEGDFVEANIDLDQFIGNNNGGFEWYGSNFSETAQEVHFAIEGDGEVPILRAQLSNVDGEFFNADLNLSEHIVNNNGGFEFQ